MAAQEIKVPDIGDFDAVEVIEVLVAEGDEVEQEQALITLESDKATLEVPSTAAGKITEMKIKEGDTVSEGDVIAMLEAAGEAEGADDDGGDEQGAETQDQEAPTEDKEDAGEQQTAAESVDEGGGEDPGGETVEVKVPDIGDFDAVEVIEVLVSEGDTVEKEQALITLESDKATLEVPSSEAGKISALKVKEGDTVSEGDVIATLETVGGGEKQASTAAASPSKDQEKPKQSSGGEKQAPKSAPSKSGTSEKHDEPVARSASAESGSESGGDTSKLDDIDEDRFSKAHASPSARRYARQLGADLGRIEGSGRKGRILEEDIQGYVKKALEQSQSGQTAGAPAAAAPAGGGGGLPQQPDVDFSQFGATEIVALERIRKISARAVHKNWLLIPHVTQFDNADITEMEAFRKANKEAAGKQGVKLTALAFLLKASAAALKNFPDMNSSLSADGESLIQKKYYHIAVAVDTPGGLLMPVIRDVDQKGVYQIARDLDEVSGRAREGKIKGSDMQGASFSISSLGGVGGTAFTPIVNSPEVAILGVSKHAWQPVWQNGEFVPRLILPLSLSYDHRVIDGAKAARITGFLSQALGDLRTLLL